MSQVDKGYFILLTYSFTLLTLNHNATICAKFIIFFQSRYAIFLFNFDYMT